MLLAQVEREIRDEANRRLREIEQEMKEEADERGRKIIAPNAIFCSTRIRAPSRT